jgi:polyvinyl alcohol dehydrogenase (cytochrome)
MARSSTTGFWSQLARRAALISALAVGISAGSAHADHDKFRCQGGGSAGDDWTRYGNDFGNNRCTETEIKTNSLERDWQITGLTGVTSVPITDHNRVYFGDWNGVLHKVKANNGEPIWQTDLGVFIRSTPVVHGSRVYAGTTNQLFALDADDGTVLWSTVLDTHPNTLIESSPVVVDGLVIVGVAGFELIFDKPEYTFRGGIVALDARTGQEVWRTYTTQNDSNSGAGVSVWSSPAIDKQRRLLYIGTGQAYSAPASPLSDSVLAIDYRTGELVWKNQFTAGDIFTVPDGGPGPDADIGATPNLLRVGGRDIVTVGSKAGIFKAMDRDTGATIWERQLGVGSSLGGIMSSAATDGKLIYVNANSWLRFGFITTNTHNPLDTSTTYALDARTGATVWSVQMPAPMFGAMALADGMLFHGLINGRIVGLDAATGALKFEDQAPGTIGSGFSVSDHHLLVGYGFNFFNGTTADAGVISYK